jgi:hypothetical protein
MHGSFDSKVIDADFDSSVETSMVEFTDEHAIYSRQPCFDCQKLKYENYLEAFVPMIGFKYTGTLQHMSQARSPERCATKCFKNLRNVGTLCSSFLWKISKNKCLLIIDGASGDGDIVTNDDFVHYHGIECERRNKRSEDHGFWSEHLASPQNQQHVDVAVSIAAGIAMTVLIVGVVFLSVKQTKFRGIALMHQTPDVEVLLLV